MLGDIIGFCLGIGSGLILCNILEKVVGGAIAGAIGGAWEVYNTGKNIYNGIKDSINEKPLIPGENIFLKDSDNWEPDDNFW